MLPCVRTLGGKLYFRYDNDGDGRDKNTKFIGKFRKLLPLSPFNFQFVREKKERGLDLSPNPLSTLKFTLTKIADRAKSI